VIKPPGGPGSVSAPTTADPTSETKRVDGPAFTDRADAARPTTGPRDATAVVADLRAGRIGAQEAFDQIVSITLQKSGAPEGLRSAVEAQVRSVLAKDPVVGSLLRQMGVPSPSEK
jgi:hypothetical protein